jgi:hypothetical protein
MEAAALRGPDALRRMREAVSEPVDGVQVALQPPGRIGDTTETQAK